MKVSIIVPTYQGENNIDHLLDSIKAQSYSNFELIIAIDGSTDQTEEKVRLRANDIEHLTIFSQENKGRASIRNFGASKASGDILVFYDDDIRPNSRSIEQHVAHHQKVSNSIMQGALSSDFSFLTKDIQRYKIHLEQKWEKTLITKSGKIDSAYLSAAHFSISKQLFDELQGFDERLRDAEDQDLANRAVEKGVDTYYDAANTAVHFDPISCRSYILRKREYANAHSILSMTAAADQRKFVPRKGLKGFVFNMLSSNRLVKMIDAEHILIKLIPKAIRFRLYDVVIQGLTYYKPTIQLT